MVADVVLPNLTKDYIPLYLRDAYFRTQSESCFKVWEKLLAETSSLASKHAHLVIKKNFELLKDVSSLPNIILNGIDLNKVAKAISTHLTQK